MVHPRPADSVRRAFYGWLLGRPYDVAALPGEVAGFEAWKRDRSRPLPAVPFEWLTAEPLTTPQWGELVDRMGWQALRMNLNTLTRHGVFQVDGLAARVADRLSDAEAQSRAKVMPYQLQVALGTVDGAVPPTIQAALEGALDRSLAGVPAVPGRVVVAPDVSGSMSSPLTGYRKGASSKVRCIDVAALTAAALMRRTSGTLVMPFAQDVVALDLDPFAPIAVNAARLAALGGGGTNVSAPLAKLNGDRTDVDLVVIVSDNQSWIDGQHGCGATATMNEWGRLKKRCPGAKLVCIDLQAHGTTQAQENADTLNVGGFSDAVFETVARFAAGLPAKDWVSEIMETEV
jgi:60 kDa SS-A/Ro ribonucleoprotein